MDYRILAYVGIGLIALYLAVRLLGQYAFGRLVDAEFSHVLNADEHKVKGRYG
ncbi:MAG: hypothetical protein NTW67_04405 [Candidatus Woesearchaeota archaeon]|jgi:hypothetical protein|nr:hypothetical protein [Candidatus Woesearchaeota archaeon]